MDYKKTNAARTTVTRDTADMISMSDTNIYEMIIMLSKRSNQIAKEIKEELHSKLEEFATHQDNLEEVFENREQIEISKFYERLPKPQNIAMQELLENNIYHRVVDQEEKNLIESSEN